MYTVATVVQQLAINEALSVGFPEIAAELATREPLDALDFIAEGVPGYRVEPSFARRVVTLEGRGVRLCGHGVSQIVVQVDAVRLNPFADAGWVQVAVLSTLLPIGVLVEIVEAILVSQAR